MDNFFLILLVWVVLSYSKIILYNYENKSTILYKDNKFETLDEVMLNISSVSNSFEIFKIIINDSTIDYTLSIQNINITKTIIFTNNDNEIKSRITLNQTQFFISSHGVLKIIGVDMNIITPFKESIFISINIGQLIVHVWFLKKTRFIFFFFRIALSIFLTKWLFS